MKLKLIVGKRIKPELRVNQYELVLSWNAGDCRHFFLEEEEAQLLGIGEVLVKVAKLNEQENYKLVKELMTEAVGTLALVPKGGLPPFTSLKLDNWSIVYYDYEGNRFNVTLE